LKRPNFVKACKARPKIVVWIEGYYNRQHLHTSIVSTPIEYEVRVMAE